MRITIVKRQRYYLSIFVQRPLMSPLQVLYFEMECFILRRTFGKCSSSKRSRESVALILGTPSGYQLAIRAGAIVPRRRNILC